MTYALKIGDEKSQVQGFLYFDVTTNFGETHSGSVSSHPLDAGVSVSDHYIAKNPTYQLKGVLSAADISGISSVIKVDGQKPMNEHGLPAEPLILDLSGLNKLLPGSVNQFFKTAIPVVKSGGSSIPDFGKIKGVLRDLMSGTYYNQTLKRYQNKMTTLTLFEFSGKVIKSQHKDLVLTSFSIEEDADTGLCIPLSMSFEKVRFVNVEKVTAPKKAATKKTSNKGIKKPTVKECIGANSSAVSSATPSLSSDPKIAGLGSKASFNSLRFGSATD